MEYAPELILDSRADLGEGPVWDAGRGLLYWVDIRLGHLHIHDPQGRTDDQINLGEAIGCVASCRSGDLILALRSGLVTFDPATRTQTRPVNPEPHLPGNRFNDGKCDPAGRFLVGTMDEAEKEASGSLYSYAPDGKFQTLISGRRISNGLTWSPDFRTFYYIDTPSRQVTAFDYDLAAGAIANSRTVISVPEDLGWPDGMTSDREGMLWVVMWGGSAVTRWDPATGGLLEAIPVPALNVTSCIFGGPDLNDLFITSARKGMSAPELEKQPLSGGLFRLRTKVVGMSCFAFGN